jgi:tungstate transport system ATP-binding protein
MSLYQLRHLQHCYGKRTVLDLPALDIERGELLALVGPSGAGKSTLLRLLQFLETPTRGTIIFNGMHLNRQIDLTLRRSVVTVFQTPALLDRSVFDNVAYGLRLRGVPLRQTREAVWAALDQVGLRPLARAAARTLSGGEAQRTALARAIALKPHALLLDEPTANLDPYNVSLIEQIIRAHSGTTIVLVTHNVFQARRLADRIGLLWDGQLIELAETDRFFSNPIDPRTRAFVNGELVY